jgi:hypothetical protein
VRQALTKTIKLVPIWDSTKHFRLTPVEDEFSVQEILTQSFNNDPIWQDEIPVDSWVAVHALPNAFTTAPNSFSSVERKWIGLSVIGVQILLLPKEV